MELCKVEDVKEPIKIGKTYLVPCILKSLEDSFIEVFPVINNLHSDKENGQDYLHYHIDSRFIKPDLPQYKKQNKLYDGHVMTRQRRCNFEKGEKIPELQYIPLKCFDVNVRWSVAPTGNSKFKRNCCKNNKCLHRGYELSNEREKNGIITCPLHGLSYRKETMELIKK